MNNFQYPFPQVNSNQIIIEELLKINETLKRIENKLNNNNNNKQNKYLEKDDNYHLV